MMDICARNIQSYFQTRDYIPLKRVYSTFIVVISRPEFVICIPDDSYSDQSDIYS